MGSENEVVLIHTIEELQAIPANSTQTYILANDIDATVTASWNDGAGFAPISAFRGTLDGQGHTIYELTINRPTVNDVGLFGQVDANGKVRNLNLENVYVFGLSNVGAVAGRLHGEISNVSVSGVVEGNNQRAGGIAGWGRGKSVIRNAHNGARVVSKKYVGGLVGNTSGLIEGSCNTGDVASTYRRDTTIGGLAGYVPEGGMIKNSFNSGSVSGINYVAGLVGRLDAASTVMHSYSNGFVTGEDPETTHGLIAANEQSDHSNVVSSYWDTDRSGLSVSRGGRGLTGEQMKDPDFWLNETDWDMDHMWVLLEGMSAPSLRHFHDTEPVDSPDRVVFQSPGEASLGTSLPIPVLYEDVLKYPTEAWGSAEAVRTAEEIISAITAGEFVLGLPRNVDASSERILPTQMLILANVYAATGKKECRTAFVAAFHGLVDAQYPSGGWPTAFPQYAKCDLQGLYGDKYADSSWDEIPSLLALILERKPPFDTDIASDIDPTLVKAVLQRIPPRDALRIFTWSDYSSRPATWWASEEALSIGDNIISWQMPHGGWWKDIAMAALPFSPERMTRGQCSSNDNRGTFDGPGTIDPMRYLAKVYDVTKQERFRQSFYRGLDFILDAQYESGGWPQRYPNPSGYPSYVTFNDNAMVNILKFIQEVIVGKAPFGFVSDEYKDRLTAAFEAGIEYILKAQIEVNGRPTAWAQQHDPVTYEPREGRSGVAPIWWTVNRYYAESS